MRRRTLSLALSLAVNIAALVLATADAGAAGREQYPVYLLDGRTLQSSRKPHAVNGRVGIYDEQRRLTWLPSSEVDLARSRPAWEAAAGQARLDTDSLTGNTLFPIAFVDDGGVKRNIPNRDAAFTFVEIWHPY